MLNTTGFVASWSTNCISLFEREMDLICQSEGITHYAPHALARGLTGIIDSLWQEYLFQPDSFDRDNAVAQCIGYLSSLFPNCYQNPSPSKSLSSSKETSDLLPIWTYSSQEFFELEIEKLLKPKLDVSWTHQRSC